MGSYNMIVNLDKKESLSPHDFGSGAKMAEWSYHQTPLVRALHNLLAGPWKGDRVYVVASHLPKDDGSYSGELAAARKELGIKSLYRFACDECRNLQPDEVDTEDHGLRYIYNHELEVFLDLAHCPVNLDDIAPLPLLIAPGGSDFDFDVADEDAAEKMEEAEAWWIDSVRSIEIRKEPLEDVDYEEFRPNFTEMGLGRYYMLVNVDKRECFGYYTLSMRELAVPEAGGCEIFWDLQNLLAGDWKGDRVYAVATDARSGWELPGNEDLCADMAQSELNNLYGFATQNYAWLDVEKRDSSDQGLRYIYNHALKVFIDLEHCPHDGGKAAMPLPLLLAIGNRGDVEGDYPSGGEGFEHVGAWCATARSIELSKEPLPGVDYAEFRPEFLPPDSWDDAIDYDGDDEDDEDDDD